MESIMTDSQKAVCARINEAAYRMGIAAGNMLKCEHHEALGALQVAQDKIAEAATLIRREGL